jgi:MinD-like ATPase involved in chromosome partitioning or flagellar assembly
VVDGLESLGALAWYFGVDPGPTLHDWEQSGASPEELVQTIRPGLDLLTAAPEEADDPTLGPARRRVLWQQAANLGQRYQLVLIDIGTSLDALRTTLTLHPSRLLLLSTGDPVSVTATFALLKGATALAPHLDVSLVLTQVEERDAERLHRHLVDGAIQFFNRDLPLGAVVPPDISLRRGLASNMTLPEASLGAPILGPLQILGEELLAPVSSASAALHAPIITPTGRPAPVDARA